MKFGKKKEDAAHQVIPWHPNFRDFERLPDIKVVRTAFFINLAAVFATIVICGFLAYGEYGLRQLDSEIAAVEARIDRDKPAGSASVELFRRFREKEQRLQEIDSFARSRPLVSPILIHISSVLPQGLALTLFDLREQGLTLRGSVRGAPEPAARLVSAWRDQLRKDKALLEYFDDISVVNMVKNPVDGRLSVELHLKFRPKK